MVLQTECYPGGYHQNNYSAYQGPNGSYSNFEDFTEQRSPYSGYPQMSTYQSTHASQHQSGWSTGGGYPGNDGSHYPGSGMGGLLKPIIDGYGSSPHGYGSHHGQSHGSPYGGHESPHGDHGSPHKSHGGPYGGHGSSHKGHGGPQSHGYGDSHGYGSGVPNPFNKPTHGHNGYGNGSPYGHGPNGYQKPTWDLKGLDSDDDE